MYESIQYPIFGTLFHPEKVSYIFHHFEDYGVDHSWNSLQMNRLFADKFMKLARMNTN